MSGTRIRVFTGAVFAIGWQYLLIQRLNAILELPSPIVDVEILNPFNEQTILDERDRKLEEARELRAKTHAAKS